MSSRTPLRGTRPADAVVVGAAGVALVAALTGCGAPASGTAGGPGGDPAGDPLAGRTFLSSGVTGDPRPWVDGTQLSVAFGADGSLTALAGCNHMGGTYELADGLLALPEALFMTEMACDEPWMAQDEWVAGFLSGGPAYAVDGETLELSDGRVTIELLDSEVADPDRSLSGTTWVLEGIITGTDLDATVSAVPVGVRSTLRITEQGRVYLRPGCNSVGGRIEVSGSTLAVDDPRPSPAPRGWTRSRTPCSCC